jgi:uncharacterized protein with GYD domain
VSPRAFRVAGRRGIRRGALSANAAFRPSALLRKNPSQIPQKLYLPSQPLNPSRQPTRNTLWSIDARNATNLAGDEIPARLPGAHIQIVYEKHFRNLHLQQNRLTRYRAKDLAELKALQQARIDEEKQNYERAAAIEKQAEATGQTFRPEKSGFVFSTGDLAAFREAKSDLRLAKLLIQLRSEGQKPLAQAA